VKYSFHPLAREEILEAVAYYEDCSAGLGMEFSKEIFSTIRVLLNFHKLGLNYLKIREDV